LEFFETEQTDASLTESGILKRECDVRPPGSNNAAIPDEATKELFSLMHDSNDIVFDREKSYWYLQNPVKRNEQLMDILI
jgi:hypothetical protein